MHFQLGISTELETFHQDQINDLRIEKGKHLCQIRVLVGLALRTLHDPDCAGGNEHLTRTRLPDLVAIFARMIHLDVVMAVFEIADAQALLAQQRDHTPNQGRLASSTGGDEANDRDGAGG